MPSGSDFQNSVDKTREAFRRVVPEFHDAPPQRPHPPAEAVAREVVAHEVEDDGLNDEEVAWGGQAPPPAHLRGLHPFFRGLLQTLPAPGTEWRPAQREQWLETARNIFALIYLDPAEEPRPIRMMEARHQAALGEYPAERHTG